MTCSQIQTDEREPAESKATKPEFGIFKKRVIVVKARLTRESFNRVSRLNTLGFDYVMYFAYLNK